MLFQGRWKQFIKVYQLLEMLLIKASEIYIPYIVFYVKSIGIKTHF